MSLDTIFNFVFPQSCFVCGTSYAGICSPCMNKLEPARLKCFRCSRKNPLGIYCDGCRKPYYPKKILARFAYKGELRELIHQFKYEDCSILQKPFGKALASLIAKIPNYKSYSIAFIPISKKRELKRGYNQARLLAEAVSKELSLPLTDTLLRVDTSKSQVQVEGPVERRRNIRKVFRLKKDATLPKKVILIDDVVTSGATVEEATKVLIKAGAKDVCVVALAMS